MIVRTLLLVMVPFAVLAGETNTGNDPFQAELERRAEAMAVKSIGRYQIEAMGDSPLAWILDTATGKLRMCGGKMAGSRDVMEDAVISCSPWVGAGQ